MIAAHKSGHCAFPQTADPHLSHERCGRNGGGNTARPDKDFQPCPCWCHVEAERYECGECEGLLGLAFHILDEDGEQVYVHVTESGDMIGAFPWECPTKAEVKQAEVSGNREPEPEMGETYYDPLLGEVTVGGVVEEEDDFSDLDFDDEEDEFADLDFDDEEN